MNTGTTESDETSSSCFPPKASILGHTQGMPDNHRQLNTDSLSEKTQQQAELSDMSCPQMWEGSSPDRNFAGRHPLSNKTTPPLFAKMTDEVLVRSSSAGSHEEPLGSGRSSLSGRSMHDPFTSSQSSFASDHQHYSHSAVGGVVAPSGSATGQEEHRGGLSVAPSTTMGHQAHSHDKGFHTHSASATSAQQDQRSHRHPGGVQQQQSGFYQDHHTPTINTQPQGPVATSISPSVQWTLDQHVPQLMKLLSEAEGDSSANDDPNHQVSTKQHSATTITTSNTNTTSQPMQQRFTKGQSKMRSIPQHQPQFALSSSAAPFNPTAPAQQKVASPQSNASCFSVTSFNDGEDPVSSPDTKNLQKAGCEFVATPFAVLKADPTLARLSPGEDTSVKEIFVGQLPFDFSPAALCDALRRLTGSQESIVTRFKMGPKPTCAFLTVKEQYEAPLLALTKKVLCDNNGMWVARSSTAAAGIQSVSKRRVALKKPGIPQRPMVLESVNQASHAPKVHHHRAPPTYASNGPNTGFYPQHQQGAGRGQQQPQQFYNQFANQPQPQTQKGAGSGMSVCLCGTRHVVAMTHSFGNCSMCARDLPSGVMVRRCPKCSGTDICTVCVAMANGASNNVGSIGYQQPQQQQPRYTQQSASSHHQFSQRHLMDEDHVIF